MWWLELSFVTLYLNSYSNKGTGVSPFQFLYGVQPLTGGVRDLPLRKDVLDRIETEMDLNLALQLPTEAMFEMVGRNVSEVNHVVDWEKIDVDCHEEDMASENCGPLEIQEPQDGVDGNVNDSIEDEVGDDIIGGTTDHDGLLDKGAKDSNTEERGMVDAEDTNSIPQTPIDVNDDGTNGIPQNTIDVNDDTQMIETHIEPQIREHQDVNRSELSSPKTSNDDYVEQEDNHNSLNHGQGVVPGIGINHELNAASAKASGSKSGKASKEVSEQDLSNRTRTNVLQHTNLSDAEKHRLQMVTETRQRALRGSERQGEIMICRATKKLGNEPKEGDVIRVGVSGHDVNKLMTPTLLGVVVGANKKRTRFHIATSTGELIGGGLPRNHVTVLSGSSRKCMGLENAFQMHTSTEGTVQQEKKRKKLAEKKISKRTAISWAFPIISVAGGMVKVYCKCTKGNCTSCKCTKFNRKCTDSCHGGKKNPNCVNCVY